jgi:hypothetical protein
MGANFRSTTMRLSRRLPNKQSCPTTLAQGVGYKLNANVAYWAEV